MAKARISRAVLVQPQDDSIRYIPLTKGKVSIVDACDYEELSRYNWCALLAKNGRWYAYRTNKKIYMHRQIMGGNTHDIDHENRDGLDNRRQNLRPCSRSQNNANREKSPNKTSSLKGVCWEKWSGRWRSQCGFNGRRFNLGRYSTEEEAHAAYMKFASEKFGEFSRPA